jgi:hypothetical protein
MNDASPWYRPLRWREASGLKTALTLTADSGERAGVAKELAAEGVSLLEANLTVRPWFDGIEVSGDLRAIVVRICGVSLEPYDETIEEPFQLRLVPPNSAHAPQPMEGEVELHIDAEDPPDVFDADIIDLGAYLVEHLLLSLSPFPRKHDAVFEPPEPTGIISPFAILARLRTET